MKPRYRVVVVRGYREPVYGGSEPKTQPCEAVVLDSARSHARVATFVSEGSPGHIGLGPDGASQAAFEMAATLNAAA